LGIAPQKPIAVRRLSPRFERHRLKTSDGVNAQNILAGKCAEYSSTNETTGSNAFRYLPLRQKRTRLEPSHDPGYRFAHPGYGSI
jgi:hypothetical protein